MDDYIDLSSFTHHPFYEQFVLEVPDNWMWGKVYNIPMDEMMRVVDHALENGYTLACGTDVSEKGFSRTKAIGVIPETDPKSMSGTEAERWGAMTAKEREAALFTFDKPMKEREITQEMRQEAFDNYETTDDHGMVIVGTAKDQNGTIYWIQRDISELPTDGRPLSQANKLQQMYSARKPLYERFADKVVTNNGTAQQGAYEIVKGWL